MGPIMNASRDPSGALDKFTGPVKPPWQMLAPFVVSYLPFAIFEEALVNPYMRLSVVRTLSTYPQPNLLTFSHPHTF